MAHILVVDDELANREVMLDVLRDAGHTVHAANNGAGALAQLETEPCDLLVTDMFMPIMDGIELITRSRELYPQLPIVAISGGDWAGHTGRLADINFRLADAGFMGTVETVHKPYDVEDLTRAVDRALGHTAALHP
jgi:CheY-like chemotaxis protein